VRERTVGLLFTVIGAALFGTLGIFGEAAASVGLSTATLLSYRFVGATVIFWGLSVFRGGIPVLRGRTLAAELGLGVVYGVMSVAYFESLAWLSAGVAALLLFTYPVQVTLVSALGLSEPVTLPKLLALLAAVGGVGLVVGGGTAVALPGVLLVGLASVCYTVYATGTRVAVADVAPLVHAAYVFVGLSASTLLYGVATNTLRVPTDPTHWALVVGITVLGTILPMILFTEGLARIEASRASIVSTSEPLTTVLLGVLLLGEPLTISIAAGAALILAGVGLTSTAAERATRRWIGDAAADGLSILRDDA
jgi:drug/metabolite transporter (DMT)-like permease